MSAPLPAPEFTSSDAGHSFAPVSLFGDAANLQNWVKLMDAVTDKMIARGDILDDLERLQARNAIWEALTLINSKSPNAEVSGRRQDL